MRCLLCFPLGFGVRVRFLGMHICLKAGVRVMVRVKVFGYTYNRGWGFKLCVQSTVYAEKRETDQVKRVLEFVHIYVCM